MAYDRSEWMYKWSRVNDPRYLDEVCKFVEAAKEHREGLRRKKTICPCGKCKNLLAHDDKTVRSHLIMFGFVKDYTVWTFHGEKAGPSGGERNNASTTTAADPVQVSPMKSSSSAITIEDMLGDVGDDGGGDGRGGEDGPVPPPPDVEDFEGLVDHLDEDDVLFGCPR